MEHEIEVNSFLKLNRQDIKNMGIKDPKKIYIILKAKEKYKELNSKQEESSDNENLISQIELRDDEQILNISEIERSLRNPEIEFHPENEFHRENGDNILNESLECNLLPIVEESQSIHEGDESTIDPLSFLNEDIVNLLNQEATIGVEEQATITVKEEPTIPQIRSKKGETSKPPRRNPPRKKRKKT